MKLYLLTAACCLLFVSAQAQAFYIKGGVGYAMPQAGQGLAPTGNPYSGSITSFNTGSGSVYNYKNSVSFLSGFTGAVGVGCMFSKHVGVEVGGFTTMVSRKYTSQYIEAGFYTNTQPQAYSYNVKTYARSPFVIIPQLVLQTGGNVFNLYTHIGVVLPVSTRVQMESIENGFDNNANPVVYNADITNKMHFTVGYTAAVGGEYYISKSASLWADLRIISMAPVIKETDLNSYTENGNNILQQQTFTTVKYSSNFTSNNISTGAPTDPAYTFPFSNIGLQAGIKFMLTSGAGKTNPANNVKVTGSNF